MAAIVHHHLYLNVTTLCPRTINDFITNLTSSYTNKSNEPTTVSSSVIMFVLAGLFFNLNLFSGISDVSAILNPKVRLFLSSALSLFLPVMSYLFSEAKNAGYAPMAAGSSTAATSSALSKADLSLTAGLILTWMLLVELLRKKVDEVRMRGHSSTIQRAGRVVWLGSLVFFNIRSAGRKAVFSILWILCATKVAQRIAFTEVGKRSYAHGKNASVLTSYMAQMLRQRHDHDLLHVEHSDHDVEHGVVDAVVAQHQNHRQRGNELLKRCKYIVMGENKLVKKATADGYDFNDVASNDGIVTVGKVWELAESDEQHHLFALYDKNQRLKRLCLSFALFKLLRRRFEHLPAMTDEEARDCRNLILDGLYGGDVVGESNAAAAAAADALFQVMNDEVNFLSEYYHSVIPVVFASPFFLTANYLLLPVVVVVLCLMSIVLCGNGDAGYAFKSLVTDNYTLRSGVSEIVVCLLAKAASNKDASAFFSLVDLAITVFLFVIFFYEEIWEFLVFLLSNWFMVALLCDYTAKKHWRDSPTFSGAFRRLLWFRSKMSHGDLRLKQFSVLNLRWPLFLPMFAPLSLAVRTEVVPNSLKRSIMDCLVEYGCRRGSGSTSTSTPLTTGESALAKHRLSPPPPPLAACGSVAEVILTWHIATSILEVERPPAKKEDSSRVATKLSRYCAYLVAFHPELLPDNKEKAERVFDDMKAELKRVLGCPAYFLSSKRTRVRRIVKCSSGGGMGGDKNEAAAAVPDKEEDGAAGRSDESQVVVNGARLARLLMDEGDRRGTAAVWKVLADVWTELIVYVAPSNDEERVKGHEEVLVQGGEFVTVLWALTTHIGVTRMEPTKPSTAATGGRPE